MLRTAFVLASVALLSLPAHAGNVTRQQSCQLMARHVADTLESRDWAADAGTEITVLNDYAAAQGEIIDEEIAASATQMSMPVADIAAMVDQQGAQIKAAMETRYGTKLYRDYAVSLLDCAKQSPEQLGSTPEAFVAMIEKIGAWAQAGK